MLTVFQVCFFVGIAIILVGFLIGNLTDGLGTDGLNLDFIGFDLMLPLSPLLVFLFLTVFGGTGIILYKQENSLSIVVITIISMVLGSGVSYLINRLVILPLKKAQNTSAPEMEELIGLEAEVTETIQKNGFGEITYVINGNTYKSPAKGSEEEFIKAGSKVAICWIKEHVFYVTKINI